MNIILTPREKEIFHLLVKNYSTKDIARKLNISEKTVRNHISNVIQKLGVKSRIQAVFLYNRDGDEDEIKKLASLCSSNFMFSICFYIIKYEI